MTIEIDPTLPKFKDLKTLQQLKDVVTTVKSQFLSVDFYKDCKDLIDIENFKSEYESYVLIEIKNQQALYNTPRERSCETLTTEDFDNPDDHPPECHHLIHKDMEMDFSLVYLYNRGKDILPGVLKQNFSEEISYIENTELFKEEMLFHFSPQGILNTHTDGNQKDPNYSFIINICCEKDCGIMKVNDRIINLGNKEAFIFDATKNPHALWNLSKTQNWFFVVLRLEPNLFYS